MDLQIDGRETAAEQDRSKKLKSTRKSRKRVEIAAEETIGDDDDDDAVASMPPVARPTLANKAKKSLLEVDSSGLSRLSLSEQADSNGSSKLDIERRQAEEEEMARAIAEVERVRLEMQRAQERIEAKHIPEEGTLVTRKKKKKPRVATPEGQAEPVPEGEQEEGATIKKKKKKKTKEAGGEEAKAAPTNEDNDEVVAAKPKKKKKRQAEYAE